MAHFIIDTYKMKWEILNLARSFSVQGNKFWLLRTFVSAAWPQSTHWISTLWLRCLSLPKWPGKPPQMRCWNPSWMRPSPFSVLSYFVRNCRDIEIRQSWNPWLVQAKTRRSKPAPLPPFSVTVPLYSQPGAMTRCLCSWLVRFLIKMGNSQWLLSKRREPRRRYGGVLLFAETQADIFLDNSFISDYNT